MTQRCVDFRYIVVYILLGHFGCLEWSGAEDKILYIAEKKCKKAVSFFTKESNEKEKDESVEKVGDSIQE